jgi:transcription elongation factor Elf1
MMLGVEPSRQHDDEDEGRVPVVAFVPFRCPRCARHKPTTYKVRGRLRYHRCRACGQRYRSFEVGPDSVGPWRPPPEPAT